MGHTTPRRPDSTTDFEESGSDRNGQRLPTVAECDRALRNPSLVRPKIGEPSERGQIRFRENYSEVLLAN